MKLSITEIVTLFQGKCTGNLDLEITELCKIEEGKPNALSFLANPKYISQIYSTQASAVLVSHDFIPEKELNTILIHVENPYAAFTTLLTQYFSDKFEQVGIEPLAYVHPETQIGEQTYIAGFAYISKGCIIGKNVKIFPHVFLGENVIIEDNSILYSGAKIYRSCRIGANCVIHSSVVIGSDGFGFAPDGKGGYIKIPQTGIVVIEDDVEVGSNTSIDRATLGETRIKKGAKIDNLVQIAHNTVVGENTVIAAQVGISGSTKIGKYCMIGGQVGIVGHIDIADGTQVGAQSGISKSVKKSGKALRGSPAQDIKNQLKSEVVFQQLPELLKKVQELEKIISHWKKD